jgi:hypothetical protein
LLQLDSTFTERDYSASTFRDFIEKMAAAGYVKLKQVDRSLLVELTDQTQGEGEDVERDSGTPPPLPLPLPLPAPVAISTNGQSAEPVPAIPSGPPAPSPMQQDEGVRAMQEAFQNSKVVPHWPMYLRNVKQFIKNSLPIFDEHRYGFHSFLEAVRSGQRAGLFRLERNRQGILRVFPGNLISQLPRAAGPSMGDSSGSDQSSIPYDVENDPTLQQHLQGGSSFVEPAEEAAESQTEGDQSEMESSSPTQPEEEKPVARKRRVNSGIKRKTVAPRKSAGTTVKRPKKKVSPPPEEGSAG